LWSATASGFVASRVTGEADQPITRVNLRM